ncbi:MAG: glycosyltransferase family 39 protein [Flavobacteriales bacterium]|nr:glycosyltransferase family 39 protein [Flavobacteriales bacterium]
MSIKTKISEHWLILLILLVATILRTWDLFNIPFTHDEMSALVRTRFNNWHDLIEIGVKTDTHPPGVQVFLFAWVKLFGETEWIVKLPFMIMGIWSIYLSYILFKKWSNETVGLIIASLLSTLQFTVMYSQIARPYISGMFLILCLLYFWDGLVHRSEKKFWFNFVMTAVFAAASAYNHHFSLLAAGLIGLTGIFEIDRKHLLKYLLLPLPIILLYAPNVGIFMHQLSRGGVGEWLGAPESSFILDFFSYALNHSLLLMSFLTVVICIGIYHFQSWKEVPKMVYWSGALFFTVLIIGYYYSVFINPVLQFSMLLFCFPSLLYFSFGWIKEQTKWMNTFIVLGILICGTWSLAIGRKHYTIFYQNRYFQMKADASLENKIETFFTFATYEHFLTHPFPQKVKMPSDYYLWQGHQNTLKEFQQTIIENTKPNLFLGAAEQFSKNLIGMSVYYYPNLRSAKYYSGAASYVLNSDKGCNSESLIYYRKNILKEHLIPDLNKAFDTVIIGHTSNSEWGIGATLPLTELIEHPYDIISIVAKVRLSSFDDKVILVGAVPNGDEEPYLWTGESSENYIFNNIDNTVTIFNTFDYNNIKDYKKGNFELSTFLWNTTKNEITVLEYDVYLLKGNRVKYCLYEDL